MTPNKEDYLKCIYEIGSRHKKITNKEIAQLMQVSPPAVTEMMKKMLAEELLVKDKKAGYLLTDLGLRLVSGSGRLQSLFGVVHSRRKACTICTNGLDDALPKVPYRNATSPTGRRNFREWRVSGAAAMSSHARTAAMRCSSLEDW